MHHSLLAAAMAQPMLDLNDLRVFAYVASLKSFSLAADELDINKSSVSRSVSRLERLLNAPLLQRTTRKVHLTRYGTALQQRCDEMLTRVNESISCVEKADSRAQNRLTICIDSGLGLAASLQNKLLPRFQAAHREIRLCLRYSSSRPELRASDVDVSVFLDTSSSARRWGSVSQHFYATPAYLERRGQPASFDDLQAHDIVATADGEGVAAAIAPRAGMGRVTSKEPLAVHGLVLAGVGIGCLPDPLCQQDVQAGRLTRLLPEMHLPPLGIEVAYPSNRQAAPAVEAFVELLQADMKAQAA